VFPPLTLSLVSFASAGVFGLLRRSLVASTQLDRSIEDIQRAEESLNAVSLGSAAESIARLAEAEAVAIYTLREGGRIRLVAAHGTSILRKGSGGFALPPDTNHGQKLLVIPIDGSCGPDSGTLVIARAARVPSIEMQKLCTAIAGSLVEVRTKEEESSRWRWPRGLAWKARSLSNLNGRIVDRAKFVDLAMRSVEDILIIAGVDGRITFANRRAAAVLDSSEQALRGRDLLGLLAEAEQSSPEAGRDVLVRLWLTAPRSNVKS
jgi:PAS domain-containing protein